MYHELTNKITNHFLKKNQDVVKASLDVFLKSNSGKREPVLKYVKSGTKSSALYYINQNGTTIYLNEKQKKVFYSGKDPHYVDCTQND